MGQFLPTQHHGLVWVDAEVAACINAQILAAELVAFKAGFTAALAALEAHAVETDLGPAVLLRDIRYLSTGSAS